MADTKVDPVVADSGSGSQPTQFEKLRAIPWSLAYDVANTFFAQLTFFGTVFILFLNDLDLNEAQIGWLLAILPVLGLLSLFITPPVARLGYKRTFLIFTALRNLFTTGLLLVPWLSGRLDALFIVRYVAVLTLAFAIVRAVANTAFLPWQQEYLPEQMRGRYAGYSSVVGSLTGLVAVAFAGYLLDQPIGDWRYPILFGIGVLFGMLSIALASRLPGGAPANRGVTLFQIGGKLFDTLRDSRFVRYLVALGLVTLAIGPVFSFLPLFMRERVGLNDGNIVLLQTGSLLGSLLSSYFWGWLADRYGSKPVALTGLLMIATLPAFWYFMPRASAMSFPIALSISLLQGIANSGWGIGSTRMLFVSIVSGENRAEYLSQYSAWMGVLSGAGSVLGGILLQSFSNYQTTIFGLVIDSYAILFGFGLLMSIVASWLLYSLRVMREAGLGEFAGLFFQGNALSAIMSVIRFYFSREETQMVTATERLGTTRSPLTVEELINSLNDPRFYVRFEAIVSITRHSANDRLIQALVEVMEGPDPALSAVVAWALGRMGSATAIPALRKAFIHSKYRSVRAHAARALGTLGDQESIPIFIERVRQDPDLGIQTACASSLGKLQVTEATADLLHVLYVDNYPQSRREMGLSLARLLGAERRYIELLRKLDEDPGTALAQEMESLRKIFRRESGDLLTLLSHARDTFARGQVHQGFKLLLQVMDLVDTETIEPHMQQILAECARRIREFGQSRMEYPVLAILVLEKTGKWTVQSDTNII